MRSLSPSWRKLVLGQMRKKMPTAKMSAINQMEEKREKRFFICRRSFAQFLCARTVIVDLLHRAGATFAREKVA